ncbi:kelch-like protein 17 [Oscarella lobularis]|uniref:kelch-like protein 17 n=1 Tax=Oscarella lobularis TaxID=121494 RepID=UPI003313C914
MSDAPNELNKSKKHRKTCFSTLNSFRSSETLCDVVLLPCADELVRIPAHRLVLAIASPYFQAMFTSGMRESHESIVRLPDVEPGALESLVDFCYTGKIQIDHSNVEAIFSAAHRFQLFDVVEFCEETITKRVNKTNCLFWAKIADQYDREKLKTISNRFAAFNLIEMIDDAEFSNLPDNVLAEILASDNLAVDSESEVISIIEKWISHDSSRADALKRLCKSSRFRFLSEADYETLQRWENDSGRHFIKKCEKKSSTAIRTGKISRILAISGSFPPSGPRTFLRSAECYSPTTDTWEDLPPPNISRHFMGVVNLDESVYVLGGISLFRNTTKFVERYDTGERRWINDVPAMIRARRGNAYVAHRGSIYAFGSYGEDCGMSERYDSVAKTWREIEPIPNCSRDGVCVTGSLLLDEQILVFSETKATIDIFRNRDYDIDQRLKLQRDPRDELFGWAKAHCVHAYDPALGRWSEDERFSCSYWNGFTVVNGRCLYRVSKRDVEMFDSRVGKWTGFGVPEHLSPFEIDVVSDDAKLYAVTGSATGDDDFYDHCRRFCWLDLRVMKWNDGPSLQELRSSCGVAVL